MTQISVPNLVRVGLYVIGSLMAIGCGGQSTPVTNSGFYRHDNEPTVYRYDKTADTVCAVVSVTQMSLFGGFAIVHIVPPSTDILGGKKVSNCQWPDGTYRAADATSAFRLKGGTGCRIDPAPLKGVIVVPSGTDVLAGRTMTGKCGA